MIERNAFEVMGTMTRITPEEEQSEKYGLIWKEFESYHDQIKQSSLDRKYYGVTFNTNEEGVFDYLAGMAVKDIKEISENLVVHEIPITLYAVFECPVTKIGELYSFIFGDWLPGSQYKINTTAPSFEEYPPEGKEAAPILIHIPVKKK